LSARPHNAGELRINLMYELNRPMS
jgi:hypothetical protein